MSSKLSIWKTIPKQPIDKVLYFNQLYNEDPRTEKVNLTVGAYRDNQGKPWDLPCVKQAIVQLKEFNNQYLPPIGDKEFCKHALKIAYSEQNGLLSGVYKPDQVSSVQALSGAGGILLALHAIKEFYEPLQSVNNEIWIS